MILKMEDASIGYTGVKQLVSVLTAFLSNGYFTQCGR